MPSHVPIPTMLVAPGEADIRRRRSQDIHKMERDRKKQASQTDKSLISGGGGGGRGGSLIHTKREAALQIHMPTLIYRHQSTAFSFRERKTHFI